MWRRRGPLDRTACRSDSRSGGRSECGGKCSGERRCSSQCVSLSRPRSIRCGATRCLCSRERRRRLEEPFFRLLASESEFPLPRGLVNAEAQSGSVKEEKTRQNLEVHAKFKTVEDATAFSPLAAKIERGVNNAGVAAKVTREGDSFTFTSQIRAATACSLLP